MRAINNKLDTIGGEEEKVIFPVISSYKEVESIKLLLLRKESGIFGQVELKDQLMGKLCERGDEKQKSPHMISLVGTRGIGKTSLAKLVYTNDKVTSNFDKKVWVCTSDSSNELEIATVIVEALKGSTPTSVDLNSLLQYICKSIMGKRILLVLDDLHIDDYKKWKPFHYCLNNCLYGSKILITTHKELVAQRMKSHDILNVGKLSEDECWSLFSLFSLLDKSPKKDEELEKIGRQIVGKCEGLPLAIKMMASFLGFEKNLSKWRSILDSDIWDFENSVSFLWLSYNDLPFIVNKCLLYCAIFPKNYLIKRDQLIRSWMAQGYLGRESNKEIEVIGQECFDQLVARCFFQEFRRDDDGNVISGKMHDIVYDFLQFLTDQEILVTEDNEEKTGLDFYNSKEVRQSMLMLSREATFPDSRPDRKKLCSLVVEGGVTNSSAILPKDLDKLSSLRELVISGKFWYENLIFDIPLQIGKLIDLRYLNLSLLKVKELPETLCELHNLQTLEISQCTNLKKLPQNMGRLKNLRHLINDETSLDYMPKEMEELTGLRTLREFVVTGGDNASEACGLGCLESLIYLQGFVTIKKLGNVDREQAERAKLEKKKNLFHLCLDFSKDPKEKTINEDKAEGTRIEAVLEALQPPATLERLEIRDYEGITISPEWMLSLRKLRILSLQDCMKIEHLPLLGELPSLESLSIINMGSVKKVNREFLGITSPSMTRSSSFIAFQKLKSLSFVNMEEWEEWEEWEEFGDSIVMPCLHSLSLEYCPKLKALPNQILRSATLTELNISWCPNLKKHYNESAGKKNGRNRRIMINFKYVQKAEEPQHLAVTEGSKPSP